MPIFCPLRLTPNTARSRSRGAGRGNPVRNAEQTRADVRRYCRFRQPANDFAQRWLGTLQWVCASPFRPNHARKNWFVAVSRLPDIPALPKEGEVRFETCRAGGKGGQHVNKTESAVRAVHTVTGISVRVESERSQHANKKRALELLAVKLAAQHAERLDQHAADAHAQLYRLERGNAVRVFRGKTFAE